MKTKSNITVIGLIFYALSVQGLWAQLDVKVFNQSTEIFSGSVIQSSSFWGDEDKLIYTKHIVKVDNVIKGNVTEYKEIVTAGGTVDGISQTYSHVLSLEDKKSYIFFCKEDKESDNLLLTIRDPSAIITFHKYPFDPLASGFNKVFNTKSEVVDFFKQYQISLDENIIMDYRYKRPERKKSKIPQELIDQIIQEKQLAINKIIEAKRGIATSKKKNEKTASNHEIIVSFENYVFRNESSIEFDIMVSTNQSGIYYDGALFRLPYNSGVFGENIAANGNLTITPGPDFNKPTTYPLTNTMFDVETDKVAINFGTQTTSNLNRTLLSFTPKVLLHVRIEATGIFSTFIEYMSEIEFADTDITSSISFYTENASDGLTEIIQFDNANYTNTIADRILFIPVITGFTPSVVVAGVDQEITISGYNFGPERDAGKMANVLFRNADKGGAEANGAPIFLTTLDDISYKSWSDNEIVVSVPTRIKSGPAGVTGVAGSGTFKVVNYGVFYEGLSSSALNVKYAIKNSSGVDNDIVKLKLIADEFDGKITYSVTQEIVDNPDMLRIIEGAIEDWNCTSDAELALEKDGEGNPVVVPQNSSENMFQIQVPVNPEALASTFQASAVCESGSAKKYYAAYTRIQINPNYLSEFWYEIPESTIVPLGKRDLREIIQHELGHSLGLQHVTNLDNSVNESRELMFYTAQPSGSLRRSITTSPGDYTVEGANYFINLSANEIYTGGCVLTNISTSQDCVAGLNSETIGTNLTVYPNPVSLNEVNIESDFVGEIISVKAYSILGSSHSLHYNDANNKIDIGKLTNGIYVLEIETELGLFMGKFIRE